MTDLERLKETLQKINCNFTSVNTLVGTTVSVYSETKTGTLEMMFEFCNEGSFSRTISTSV